MPLRKGRSRRVIHLNIREMIRAGYSQPQAIAASLRSAGVKRKKKAVAKRKKKYHSSRHGRGRLSYSTHRKSSKRSRAAKRAYKKSGLYKYNLRRKGKRSHVTYRKDHHGWLRRHIVKGKRTKTAARRVRSARKARSASRIYRGRYEVAFHKAERRYHKAFTKALPLVSPGSSIHHALPASVHAAVNAKIGPVHRAYRRAYEALLKHK